MKASVRPISSCELLQQGQDLRLRRDVEAGDDLVGEHESRRQRQWRARCRRAGAGRRTVRGGSGWRKLCGRPTRCSASATSRRVGRLSPRPFCLQRRGDDAADGPARIERRHRILEDHLQIAAQRPQLRLRQMRDVAAVEADRAGASALAGAPGRGRASTCPNPIRRQCRSPIPRAGRSRGPSGFRASGARPNSGLRVMSGSADLQAATRNSGGSCRASTARLGQAWSAAAISRRQPVEHRLVAPASARRTDRS